MNKKILIPLSALILASCGGEHVSSESLMPQVDPEEAFSALKASGSAYSKQDNIGYSTDDLNFSMSATSVSNEGEESKIDMVATDVKVSTKHNNVNDEDASNLKSATIFQEGALSLQAPGSEETTAISRLRPAFYLDNYTMYMDISENGMIRTAINALINSLQFSWAPTWSFPSKGKGYREIVPHSLLDENMPMGGNDGTTSAIADALSENYEEYKQYYTFSLTNNEYSIVFESTDKTALEKIVLDEYEKSSSSDDQEKKEEGKKKIENFFEALTIKSFSLGFAFDESSWNEVALKYDFTMDKYIQKKNDPDASFYYDSLKGKTHLNLLDEEEAKIAFPADMGKKGSGNQYKYEEIPLPLFNIFG